MGNQRFSITPARAVGDSDLTDGEYRTLAAFGLFSDKNGWSNPSDSTIAKILNISRRTVIRHRKKLISAGYMNTIPRYTKHGGQSSNYTQIKFDLNIPEAPPPVTSKSHTPRDSQSHTPGDSEDVTPPETPESHTNAPVNAPDNAPDNESDFSFPFDTKKLSIEPISQPAPGRSILEAILFPLMPKAADYFPTVNGAAYKYGHEETKNALMIAFEDWKNTKTKKKKPYNPHNYAWIELGIALLETGEKSYNEPAKESKNGKHKNYTQEDLELARRIRTHETANAD